MEKSQIWTIVGISLIVAVVASVGMVYITGNIIAVDPIGKRTSAFVYTTSEVYNKTEIDAKLAPIDGRFSTVDTQFSSILDKLDQLIASHNPTQCNPIVDKLYQVSRIINMTTGFSEDKVELMSVKTGDVYAASITREGYGTIFVAGVMYNITYSGSSTITPDESYVKLYKDGFMQGGGFKNAFLVLPR